MLQYYSAAIPRAFYAAIEWAFSQGWILSLLLGLGATFFTALRAARRHHTWGDAMKDIRTAITDFAVAFVGATVVVLVFLFVVFFVKDAPNQFTIVNDKIKTLTKENNSLRAQLTAQNSKGLFIECHFGIMPNAFPSSGRIYILYLSQY